VEAAINQQRIQAGLHPLILNPLLNQAAQAHVADMIAHHHYSHTGTDGSDVSLRVRRTGYALSGNASENWVSVRDPSQAIQWWMNSRVHRGNILNGKWREFGVGAGVQPSSGQTIFVAVFATGAGDSAAASAPPPPPEAPAAPQPAPSAAAYVVQPGDTLMDIALRHGIAWNALAAFNGLSENEFLQIGQTIRLPGIDQGQVVQKESAPPQAAADPPVTRVADVETMPQDTIPYAVQDGDTLVSIAAKFGTSWETLAALNQLDAQSFLQPGQTLRVPQKQRPAAAAPAAPVTAAAHQAPPLFHVVQPGDTLISIANRYNLSLASLMNVNSLTENDVIQVGQQLQLP
jgi:LysM repeat protein